LSPETKNETQHENRNARRFRLMMHPFSISSIPPSTTLGYTDGKQCYFANGCYLPAKFSQCLDCCMSHCPTPWYSGCVDECIARFDPKDVYAAAIDATRTISERKSEGQYDARTMLVALQGASDRRMAHAARLLAVEAQDFGGASGILQGNAQ
jgi:hypothetical protein